MLENSLVVQSAISTFNNAALRAPDFFWLALLCLPVFAVFWIFAPQIADRFAQSPKDRMRAASTVAIAAIFVWILTHQGFGTLRDGAGASYVGTVLAVMLCACATFLSRRYYEWKPRLSQCFPKRKIWNFAAGLAVPAAAVAIAGAGAISAGWQGMAMQAGAVAIGALSGYLLHWKNAGESDPKMLVGALMFLGALGLVMQPEFFRFGQLGNLSVIHLIFLAATAAAISAYAVLGVFSPRGRPGVSAYKKIKLILRMLAALVLILFFTTESAAVFVLFAVMAAALAFVSVRHQPAGKAGGAKGQRDDLWFLSLGLFGILAALPVLTAAAVVLWRLDGGNVRKIKEVF